MKQIDGKQSLQFLDVSERADILIGEKLCLLYSENLRVFLYFVICCKIFLKIHSWS